MKIGVVTFCNSNNNYGQILQAFALQKFLRKKGHDAYLISYKSTIISFGNLIKDILKCILYFLFRLPKYEEIFLCYKNKQKDRKRDFKSFKNIYLQKSKIEYHSLMELKKNPPEADIYITGSDQVWNNTACKQENAIWYLDFGKKNIIRASYAASSGRKFTEEEVTYLKKYLNSFKFIGVREKGLLNEIQSLGFDCCDIVLDPTLLLSQEDYLSLCKTNKTTNSQKYIFIYILNIQNSSEIYWNQINKYRKEQNLECKIVTSSGYYQAKELIDQEKNIQATIPEWIWYINNAEFIVTTSFHGVVFCIKFQKPFIAIPLKGKYSKGNERIFTLLEKLGLSSRIFSEDKSFAEQVEAPIDWAKVNRLLKDEIEKSEHILNYIIS